MNRSICVRDALLHVSFQSRINSSLGSSFSPIYISRDTKIYQEKIMSVLNITHSHMCATKYHHPLHHQRIDSIYIYIIVDLIWDSVLFLFLVRLILMADQKDLFFLLFNSEYIFIYRERNINTKQLVLVISKVLV